MVSRICWTTHRKWPTIPPVHRSSRANQNRAETYDGLQHPPWRKEGDPSGESYQPERPAVGALAYRLLGEAPSADQMLSQMAELSNQVDQSVGQIPDIFIEGLRLQVDGLRHEHDKMAQYEAQVSKVGNYVKSEDEKETIRDLAKPVEVITAAENRVYNKERRIQTLKCDIEVVTAEKEATEVQLQDHYATKAMLQETTPPGAGA